MPPRPTLHRHLHISSPLHLAPPPPPASKPRPHTSMLSSLFDASSRASPPAQSQFPSSSSATQSPESPTSASTATNDAVRTMMDVLARNRPEVIDDRRRFAPQTLLRPHDLTRSSLYPAQRPNAKPPLLGPRKAVAISIDPFHQSSQSPLDHVLNPYFAQAFVNPLGRLKTRAETGLTRRSQRKVGKMVRRARAMGLISKFSDRTAPGGYGSPLIARGT